MPPQTRSMSGLLRAPSPVQVKERKTPKEPKALKKPEKYEKKSVPKVLRNLLWELIFGIDVGQANCCCCETNKIQQHSFHCGHIVSERDGGRTVMSNLLPICAACNGSMGTENLYEFKRRCGFKDTSKCTPKDFAQGLLEEGKPIMSQRFLERITDEYNILLAYETIFDLETEGKINRCDRKGQGFAGKYIRLTA